MTDKKKPTVQFGDYSKDFLDAFERETQKLKENAVPSEPKTLDDQETQELLEALKQLENVDKEVRPVEKKPQPISESKMDEYLTTLRDIDNKQKNIDKTTPIQEGSDLLGGAKDAVTQKQLRQATGELFARIQTSLASVGGGGLGTIMQGVQGNPQGGQLPMYNDSSGKMVWATVFGVGEAYGDSDALQVILDTVDSAYVNARVNASAAGGLDSAQIINLIDSDYVAARDSDGGFYTTADHDSDTLAQVDSAYINARVNAAGISTTDSLPEGVVNLYYTTARHDSDTLLQVDSAYVQARQLGGGLDSGQIINLIDSAYIQSRDSDYGDDDVINLLNAQPGVENVIPMLDSEYTLGSPTNKWKDLYLSNNSIYMGDNLILSGSGVLGDTYLYVNNEPVFPGALDSAKVINLIDSAYIAARDSDKQGNFYKTINHDSDTLVQVDSGYIANRLPDLYGTPNHDSDTLVQVDNAYVQARQIRTLAGMDDTQIDSLTIATDDFLQWNGTDWIAAPFNVDPALSFEGTIDATVGGDSAPSATGGALYINSVAGVVAASFNGIAGDSIDASQAIAYAESDGIWYIIGNTLEAGVVEVRQGNGISVDDSNPARPFVAINRTETDTWYLDSAKVISLVDSAYVNLRSDHYTTANHDSDTLFQVDSAYVQARVNLLESGLDSERVVNIVDSYVDSFHLSNHWRSLENRFVPIIGPSTQTEGLEIADSFQINRGEMFFGSTRIYINQTEIGDFIVDSSLQLQGNGALQKLEEANGTYVGVGGGFNNTFSIMRSDDYAAGVWDLIPAQSHDSTGMLYQVKGNGLGDWVAVGHKRQVLYSNDDALSWYSSSASANDFGTGDFLFEILWDGTKWSLYGDQGDVMTSTDGSSWTSVTTNLGNTGYIKAAYYDTYNSRYVIGDTSGKIWHTQDATLQNWTQASNMGTTAAWYDIIYDDVRGIWTVFGDNGQVATTNNPNDFTSWTSRVVGSGDNFRQAKANQYGDILAVGFNNLVVTSRDGGATFSTVNVDLPASTSLYSVLWHDAEDRWVFGADNRRLFYQIIQQGQDGLYFDNGDSDLRLLTRGDSDFILSVTGDAYGDSDVTLHVDSGYISARLPAGSIIAGGRFIVGADFAHDSSDALPSYSVKSLWGAQNIQRQDAGQYRINFDSANQVALDDSYSYIVQTTIDYNGDNPTASTRNVAVLDQAVNHFVLLMERADDGANQDYTGNPPDQPDRGARINFSVIKAS